jgi:hypothetical protein
MSALYLTLITDIYKYVFIQYILTLNRAIYLSLSHLYPY